MSDATGLEPAVDDARAQAVPAAAAEDFEVYRARVREARIRGADDVIYNNSHEHAAVLVEELFNSAKTQVGVLCRNLDGAVYERPEVIGAAQAFLERRDATLTLLIEQEIDRHHAFLTSVADDPRFRGRVKVYSPISLPEGAGFNFMVADKMAYRYEEDANLPNAIACFNAPEVAAGMSKLIEGIATLEEARASVSSTGN